MLTQWHCRCYVTCVQTSTKARKVHDLSVLSVETGDFLNCEGSGLFLLQSSCKCRWCPCYERCHFSSDTVTLVKRPSDDTPPPLTPAGNHSCIPNAEASFPDNNFLLQLSALSDINPGEVSWHVWIWSDKFWPGLDGTECPSLALCAPLSDGIRRLRLWGLEWVCQAVRKIEKPCVCAAQ